MTSPVEPHGTEDRHSGWMSNYESNYCSVKRESVAKCATHDHFDWPWISPSCGCFWKHGVMKDDPLRLELLAELRSLRRLPGMFGVERIALSDMLVEFVGRGSVQLAYTTLLDVNDRDGKDPEGPIRAYFETAGVGVEGDNLDARLKAYAQIHHVEQRTGLRRSDRGAEELSYVLRDVFNYERPWCNLAAVQSGARVDVAVSIHLPEHSKWRRPHVYINEVKQENRLFELHDDPVVFGFVSGREKFDDIALDVSADDDTPLLRLRVVWIMPVWPSWQNGAHMVDPRLYARLTNDRDGSAGLTIYWTNAEAAESRAQTLLEYPGWVNSGPSPTAD
jgi:hypothetical protein